MLILVRRRNESIVIGSAGLVLDSPILIDVLGVRHDGGVRLGITASSNTKVMRSEIVNRRLLDDDELRAAANV